MQYTINLYFYNCASRQRGQQYATQRIAQGVAKTTLQRLQGDLGALLILYLYIHYTRLKKICYGALHGSPSLLLLFRIKFNNQVFVDIGWQFTALGSRLEYTLHLLNVHIDPVRETALLRHVQ